MPRDGAMRGAIDREHLTMAREIAEAYVDSYLEVFAAEGLIPDANDLQQMRSEIKAIVVRHESGGVWRPRPATTGALSILADQVYGRLANRVSQLELESKLPRATAVGGAGIHVGGHNYGAIQQGGQKNSQSLTVNTQLNTKIQELVNLIDGAQELTALQRVKACNDLRYVQELTALEISAETKDEARSKLDSITSIISLSADLVSLGMPVIQIIRVFFGL